jgi:hypothetical protein
VKIYGDSVASSPGPFFWGFGLAEYPRGFTVRFVIEAKQAVDYIFDRRRIYENINVRAHLEHRMRVGERAQSQTLYEDQCKSTLVEFTA